MKNLKEAEIDLRFLLNRGYRKKIALNFVANHYLLGKSDRNYLSRLVFSDDKAQERKSKRLPLNYLEGKYIVIDGYNILITVESILKTFKSSNKKQNLILSDDGFLRDAESVFGKYRIGPQTIQALELILRNLKKYKPQKLKFIFDQQVSFSGKLVQMVHQNLLKEQIKGNALLSERVDHDLIDEWKKTGAIMATSDGAIIDAVDQVIDIPHEILKNLKKEKFKEAPEKIIENRLN